MPILFKMLGLCLLGLVVINYLHRSSREFSLLCLLALLVTFAYLLLLPLREIGEIGSMLFALTGISEALLAALLKVLAIALVVRVAAALCRDASQSSLAVCLEIGGTLCALEAAAPLVKNVLALVEDWL